MNAMKPAFTALGFALSALAIACSSQDTKHPEALGGCVPTDASPCPSPAGEIGASLPDAGVSSSSSSSSSSGASFVCGSVGMNVTSMNLYCHMCIATNCCNAESLCTSDCLTILDCMQANACSATDSVCIGLCENPSPNGLSSYQDLVSCVSAMCASPLCPTLPE
jgi:hypothetical protein